MAKRARFATFAISIKDPLCLLQQYKIMEHNQNPIAAINHQGAIQINFHDHS